VQFATLKTGELAAVIGGSFVPFGNRLIQEGVLPTGATMLDFIARNAEVKDAAAKAIERGDAVPGDAELLRAPVENVSKIWAAASNYRRGSRGLGEARGRGEAVESTPEEILEMAFLKPPSAIVGPGEAIVIPPGARTIFPELELGVVIGKTARNLPRERAMEAVFGYTIILDVTARGYGSGKSLVASRCVRKGFDTFAPIGPWITTRDQIANPQDLQMQLWVNGELRQSARTDAMINGVAALVSYLSEVSTLQPGDLISTGNPDAPAFQQELKPGDELVSEIEGIGQMRQTVR
jgi:2-keto-4-pentenoate hydratase/2-oxohepta-3-ene-1,7-dioic acid hydratase in catechol pathway